MTYVIDHDAIAKRSLVNQFHNKIMLSRKTQTTVLSIIALSVVSFSSCKKDDDPNDNNKTSIIFNPNLTYGTMTDVEGNSYKTIQIGNQTWMAENLRTTKYNDGSNIHRGIADSAWYYTSAEGIYYTYNDTRNTDTTRIMGMLYSWYAVNTDKLAPNGWHIPTQAEWDELVTYLGGTNTAGGKMKETGFTHWGDPNLDATNESGFTALPAGRMYPIGSTYTHYSFAAWFWSTTSYSAGEAIYCGLDHTNAVASRYHSQKIYGYSVRCVKD